MTPPAGETVMAKGQEKPKDKKKPKQEKSGAPKSAYAQSMSGKK
jgi:hypothetical protein